MSISPSWLEFEEGLGGRPVLKGTAEEMCARFTELCKNLAPLYPPPMDTVTIEQGSFNGTEYRIYTPRSVGHGVPEKFPVGVYFHGGGFVLGNLDSDDMFCQAIAENTNVIIINVHYRLAPAHKAPAQLEDAVKMVEWVYHDATFPRADQTKLFTIGTSAGGALALGVARRVGLDQSTIPKDTVKGVVAFNPVVFHPANTQGVKHTTPKVNVNNTPIIDQEALLQYFELCDAQPDNADYFVGLDPESHVRLPPAYFVTCGFDPLGDDGRVLAESMESHGVQVKSDHYNSLPHCFWIVPTLPESKAFMVNAFQGIKWVLDKMY